MAEGEAWPLEGVERELGEGVCVCVGSAGEALLVKDSVEEGEEVDVGVVGAVMEGVTGLVAV